MSGAREANQSDFEVVLDIEAAPEEIEAVRSAFAAAGLSPKVEAALETRSVEVSPWVISVSEFGAGAFFGAFMAAAGAGSAQALGRLVRALYAARRASGRRGYVDFSFHGRSDVLVADDLPEAAYGQLIDLVPEMTPSGQIRWSVKTQRWRDSWDATRDDET